MISYVILETVSKKHKFIYLPVGIDKKIYISKKHIYYSPIENYFDIINNIIGYSKKKFQI